MSGKPIPGLDPAIRQRSVAVNGVELDVLEAGTPGDPLVVLAHGFPEGAYSWRHQLGPLAKAGYHVLAPDQRGYGGSSCPAGVTDYGIQPLAGDLLGLADWAAAEARDRAGAAGGAGSTPPAVFVGHDWGALIVWDLARLYPDRVRAVVAVSVPYVDWPAPPTQLFQHIYGDDFFYITYFQTVGPADAELGADPRKTMARILWSASGDSPKSMGDRRPAVGTGFLDMMADPPATLPGWLTEADIEYFAAQFRRSGFFGPISYYRNLDANFALVHDLAAPAMPSFFIGGTADMVIARDPKGVERMRDQLAGYRGHVLLDGIGHWTQQEAPDAFNTALLGFLAGL